MEALLKTWKTSRKIYAVFFDQYTLEQLNTIPQGYSNNLIWNIGHIIVAQQSLIYRLSGLPMLVTDDLFNRYKPGSKPEAPVTQAEADELKRLLLSEVEQFEADYAASKFVSFTERMTVTGFHLGNLNDALEFNNYHEGLHLGYMMGIRKFV